MIGLPEDLYLQCEEIVKSGKHGYASVSELVKDGTRRRLEELEKFFQCKKEGKENEADEETSKPGRSNSSTPR